MNANLRKQSLKLLSLSLGSSTKEKKVIGMNLHLFLGLCSYFQYRFAFLAIFLTTTLSAVQLHCAVICTII